LAARDSLQLEPGAEVWLVIKTHSCHLMQTKQPAFPGISDYR
jgi:hypothetical protein